MAIPSGRRGPRFETAPRVTGEPRVGCPLAADPGRVSGEPAPALAWRWQRDGVDIRGAAGAVYTPGPEDDGARIRLLVTAANAAGEARAVSAPVVPVHAPPAVTGRLFDLICDLGTGEEVVDAAASFEGAGLRFSATGPGTRIDPGTGRLRISTRNVIEAEPVVVVAQNSGGNAAASFHVTVEDLGGEPLRIVVFDAPGDVAYLGQTGGDGSALVFNASGKDFVDADGAAAPIVPPDPAPRSAPWAGFEAEWEDSGRVVFVNRGKRSFRPRVYFDALVPAGEAAELGMAAAGTGVPGAAWTFVLGTPGDPRAYGLERASRRSTAPVHAFAVPVADEDRIVRMSLELPNGAGDWRGIGAIWARNLDGGEAPLIVNQDSGAAVQASLEPRAYYVAPESGDNAQDGLAPETPLRSLPLSPAPGSTVVFRGGERLREPLVVAAAGLPEAPLVYDFNADGDWGEGPAILDGGAPLTGWRPEGNGLWSAPWPEGEGPGGLVAFQDDRRLAVAQLPRPSDPGYAGNVEEFARAEAMTRRSLTARSWLRAHFRNPASLVGARVRLWGRGNLVFSAPITAVDARRGTIGFDAPGRFRPYKQPERWRFAVYDHPEAMTAAGQFYRSQEGRLVLRPYDGADPTEALIDRVAGGTALAVRGDHVRVRGGLIRKWGGTRSLHLDHVSGCTVEGTEIQHCRNRYTLHVDGGALNAVRDCTVRDCGGRGIFFQNARRSLAFRNEARRVSGTQMSFYGTEDCAAIGNRIGEVLGAHSNGVSAYLGNSGLLFLFNDIRCGGGGIPFTLQNTEGRNVVALNTLLAGGDRYGLALWPPSNNGLREVGENVYANNVILASQGGGRALIVNNDMHLCESTVINNVADGIGAGLDGRFEPHSLTIKRFALVDGGAGNGRRNLAARGGRPAAALRFDLRTRAPDPPTETAHLSLNHGGRYPSATDLPSDMDRIACFGDPAGAAPLVVSGTASQYAPELVTRNIRTGVGRIGPDAAGVRMLGDVDGTRLRARMFAAIVDADVDRWDVAPSGAIDLSGGQPWTLVPRHPLLPNAPTALAIDHQGRYLMDGSEVADWTGWI